MLPELERGLDGERVLITGGAGFIGSRLAMRLLIEGAQPIVFDDLSAPALSGVRDHEDIIFAFGDVRDERALRQVFSARVDTVVHLAAQFANARSLDAPERDLLVNGLGTLKVLRCAEEHRVRRFVHASSSCVYGDSDGSPLSEDFVSLIPETPYHASKLAGELCVRWHAARGLPAIVVRPFNVYGPGELPHEHRNVVPRFVWAALRGEALPICGAGDELTAKAKNTTPESAQQSGQQLAAKVRQNPAPVAVGGAVLVGFLLGRLTGRRS